MSEVRILSPRPTISIGYADSPTFSFFSVPLSVTAGLPFRSFLVISSSSDLSLFCLCFSKICHTFLNPFLAFTNQPAKLLVVNEGLLEIFDWVYHLLRNTEEIFVLEVQRGSKKIARIDSIPPSEPRKNGILVSVPSAHGRDFIDFLTLPNGHSHTFLGQQG